MAIALLALPLEEAARRRRGLEVAQSLLLGAGRGGGVLTPAGRDDFVQRMAGSLTAAEQVALPPHHDTCCGGRGVRSRDTSLRLPGRPCGPGSSARVCVELNLAYGLGGGVYVAGVRCAH